MGRIKLDRIKKGMAILLVVLFVVSVSSAAVSASPYSRHRSSGSGGASLVDVDFNNAINTQVAIATSVNNVFAINNEGNIDVHSETSASNYNRLYQRIH